MKNFVKYSINSKKIFFKNLIVNQLNEEKQKQQQQSHSQAQTSDLTSPNCTDHSIHRLLNIKSNKINNIGNKLDERFGNHDLFNFKADTKLREQHVVLDIQFIVECVFLALIDLDG